MPMATIPEMTPMPIVRAALAAVTALLLTASVAAADDAKPPPPPGDWQTGVALVGTPHYQSGFTHFDYVNPAAPKGGTVRLDGSNPTFDTLNPILPKGVPADGAGLIYDSLFTPSFDEEDISAEYGEIADAMRFPADFSYVTYRINPKARWHDGTPITADDVVWTFNKTVDLDPSRRFYYRHVVKAEKTAPDQVTFTFDVAGNRELPQIVGQLLILPQHWWEGKDANGKQRDIGESTLEPPLGSGPYKISEVIPGRSITYERVPDYWGKDLPVNVGTNNFDKVSYLYFRDLDVAFEAFKAGQFDFWDENEAKRWATGYAFPAFNSGQVKKDLVELARASGVMVGFVPNLRRPLFQDIRVRRAFNLAFDFETLNRTIFYGQYARINSFFFGLPQFSGADVPSGAELDILNSVKDKVAPEVLTTPYVNPENATPDKQRANLRQALQLMQEAGYTLNGNKLVDKTGKPVTVELLLNGPVIERVAIPYAQSLAKIGITLTIRTVDSSQFVTRMRSRDFDMIYTGWGESNSPGNEQMDQWGSAAADKESSSNYGGIKDPAVDAIIDRIIYNKGRDDQVAAVKALDRVLLMNQYVIPSYTLLAERIAYWDRFGHPNPYPKFEIGFPSIWWWDADKAGAGTAKTGSGG
jgi:microcin C transport system substrate-binding protein